MQMWYRPSRLLPITLLLYALNILFGPFRYEYYSWDAIGYLALCFLMIWVGCLAGETTQGRPPASCAAPREDAPYAIGKGVHRLLILGMLLSLGASLATAYYLFFVSGLSYAEGLGAVRNTLSRRAYTSHDIADPVWSKLAEAISYVGAAYYLVLANLDEGTSRTSRLLALLCLMGPAAATILQGGRNNAIAMSLLLVAVGVIRRRCGQTFFPGVGGTSLALGTIGAVVYYTFRLFVLRAGASSAGDVDPQLMSLVLPGDVELRRPFHRVNEALAGALGPIYLLSFYFSHSLSFFSYLFDAMDYSRLFYGALLFRLFGFIAAPLGLPLPSQNEIVHSQPFFGRYTSFAQGFLLDWGLYGTLAMSAATGLIWGRVWHVFISGGFWARVFYPAVMAMIIASPIYFFPHWGGMDFTLVGLFGIWLISRKAILRSSTASSSSAEII